MKRELWGVMIVIILSVFGWYLLGFNDLDFLSPDYPPIWGGGRGFPERDGLTVPPAPIKEGPAEVEPVPPSVGSLSGCDLGACTALCQMADPPQPCVVEFSNSGTVLCGSCGTSCPPSQTRCGGGTSGGGSIKCCGPGMQCINGQCARGQNGLVP